MSLRSRALQALLAGLLGPALALLGGCVYHEAGPPEAHFRHGLIRHHAVKRLFAKDDFGKWTHWAALIREMDSGELFAIDSSASVNGENPTVQSAASFYVPDSSADAKPPETSRYADSDGAFAGFSDEGSAAGMSR